MTITSMRSGASEIFEELELLGEKTAGSCKGYVAVFVIVVLHMVD